MSIKEMEPKIRELRELQRMQEELADEIGTMQDAIKAEMAAQGTDTLCVGEYKVSWKSVTSSRIDTTALKAQMPDVAAQFTKTTETRRFLVK